MRSWRWPHALGLLLVLHAALLWDVLRGDATLFTRDVFIFLIPFKWSAAQLLLQGVFPSLSAALPGGAPLWAHPSAEVATPATLLFTLWPDQPLRAFGAGVVLHGCTAGMGAYALARTVGVRPVLATVVALGFAGCGPVASAWTIKAMPAVSLPWMLTGGALLGRGRWQTTGVLLLCAGSLAACLHPDPPALLSAGVLAALVAVVRARRAQRVRVLGMTCAAGLLGVLCSGAFLWPALQVIGDSMRGQQGAWNVSTTLGLRWVELLAPNPLGVPGATGSLQGAMGRLPPSATFVGSLFLGGTAWLGVLVGQRRRLDRVLLWATGVLLLLAHGDAVPGAGAVWAVLHARFPDKLVLPAYLLLAVQSARGIQRALPAQGPGRAPLAVLSGLALLGLAVADGVAAAVLNALPGQPTSHHALDVEFCAQQLRTGLSLLLVTALLATWAAFRRQRHVVTPLWLGLACLELALGSTTALPTTPVGALTQDAVELAPGTRVATGEANRLFARLPTRTAPDMPPSTASAEAYRRAEPSTGVPRGLVYPLAPDVGGFDARPAAAALYGLLPRLSPPAATHVLRAWGVDALVSANATPAEGVRILTMDRGAQGPLHVHTLDNVPAVTSVHTTWETAVDSAAGVERLSSGATLVQVEGAPPPVPGATAVLERLHAGAEGVTARVRVDSGTALLVHRAVRRAGWEVLVDDAPAPVLLVNGLHLGAMVPRGDHTVTVRYVTPGGAVGALLSALGWIALAAWLTLQRRPR